MGSWMNASSLNPEILQVEIITLAFLCPILTGSQPYLGPAFDTALIDIQQTYPRLNFSQTVVSDERIGCDYLTWLSTYENLLASFYFNFTRTIASTDSVSHLTAFVVAGGGDAYGMEQFALQLDKFFMSSVASKDNSYRPNWATTSINSVTTFIKVFINLVQTYDWRDIIVVADTSSNPFFLDAAKSLEPALIALARQVTFIQFASKTMQLESYRAMALRIGNISRIVFYLGNSQPLQKLMTAAAEFNMTNGDYIYMALLSFRHLSFGSFRWVPDASEQHTASQFKYLLVIEPLVVSENGTENLTQSWRKASRDKYNYTYGKDELMTPHPVSTYAAMMTLAQVLEEMRVDNVTGDLSSGRNIAKRFSNRTFALKTGKMQFSLKGERIPDMTITQTDDLTGYIQVVMEQSAASGLLRETAPIRWDGVWPVPNKPRCGFRGDAVICQITGSRSLQYGASVGAIVVVLCLSMLATWRIRLKVNGGEEYWWLVRPDFLCYRAVAASQYAQWLFEHKSDPDLQI